VGSYAVPKNNVFACGNVNWRVNYWRVGLGKGNTFNHKQGRMMKRNVGALRDCLECFVLNEPGLSYF
jgi:hypothetical protein